MVTPNGRDLVIVCNRFEEELKILPDKRRKKAFEYLEREEVGAVNLYKRIGSNGSAGTVGPSGVMTGGAPNDLLLR